MSPQQAIPLLRRQIQRLDEIVNLHFKNPAVDAWESTTINALNAVYGQPNGTMHSNAAAIWAGSRIRYGMRKPSVER